MRQHPKSRTRRRVSFPPASTLRISTQGLRRNSLVEIPTKESVCRKKCMCTRKKVYVDYFASRHSKKNVAYQVSVPVPPTPQDLTIPPRVAMSQDWESYALPSCQPIQTYPDSTNKSRPLAYGLVPMLPICTLDIPYPQHPQYTNVPVAIHHRDTH